MASEVVKLRLSVDDVRRWTPASETFSFCSLLAKARSLTGGNARITYVDSEGDTISVATPEDFAEMRKELSPPLKLNVVAGSNSLASVDSVVLALSDARLFDEEVALSGSDLGSALQVLSSFAPRARLVASGGGDARKLLSDIKSALKAAPVLTSQNEVVDFIHHGVTCDNCDAFPIRGTRYKSVTKPDFDLCSRCFDSNEAHLNDVYLKITGQPPAASEPDWETVLSGEQEVRQRIHPPAFIALAEGS